MKNVNRQMLFKILIEARNKTAKNQDFTVFIILFLFLIDQIFKLWT